MMVLIVGDAYTFVKHIFLIIKYIFSLCSAASHHFAALPTPFPNALSALKEPVHQRERRVTRPRSRAPAEDGRRNRGLERHGLSLRQNSPVAIARDRAHDGEGTANKWFTLPVRYTPAFLTEGRTQGRTFNRCTARPAAAQLRPRCDYLFRSDTAAFRRLAGFRK